MGTFRTYGNFVKSLPSKMNAKFTLPDKYKDTIVEKWAIYWKSLIRDYKDAWTDTVTGCKERPLKASIIFSMLFGCGVLARTNPTDRCYRQRLLSAGNDLALVPDTSRSQRATAHLAAATRADNAGFTRRLNLGVVSFMWRADFALELGLYAAQCSRLGPQIATFHHRIIDVGFLSRWWMLEAGMHDYDVSDQEFPE